MEAIKPKRGDTESTLPAEEEKGKLSKAKPKKIPLYGFFKFCGVSEKTLDEASIRYQQGFLKNMAFILSQGFKNFKNRSLGGKALSILKVITFPFYQIVSIPVSKAVNIVKGELKKNRIAAIAKIRATKLQEALNSRDQHQVHLQMVSEKPNSIHLIENPSEEIQLAAVKRQGSVIQYLENPSEDVQFEAVLNDHLALQLIKDPSEHIQCAAVWDGGYDALKYIKHPSEHVLITAVRGHEKAIKFIENPSENVKLAAVSERAGAFKYIDNPSEKIWLAAARSKDPDWAVVLNPLLSPPVAVQVACVERSYKALAYIIEPSETVLIAALKQDIASLDLIETKDVNTLLKSAGYVSVDKNKDSIPNVINWGTESILLTEHQKKELLKNNYTTLWGNDIEGKEISGYDTVLRLNDQKLLIIEDNQTKIEGGAVNYYKNTHFIFRDMCEFKNGESSEKKFDIESFVQKVKEMPDETEDRVEKKMTIALK